MNIWSGLVTEKGTVPKLDIRILPGSPNLAPREATLERASRIIRVARRGELTDKPTINNIYIRQGYIHDDAYTIRDHQANLRLVRVHEGANSNIKPGIKGNSGLLA